MLTREQVLNLTTDDVESVYSGRPGCCCGCLGNHRLNPKYKEAFLAEAAEKAYVLEKKDFSAKIVAKLLERIQSCAQHPDLEPDLEIEDGYVSIDTDVFTITVRRYIVYLATDERKAQQKTIESLEHALVK